MCFIFKYLRFFLFFCVFCGSFCQLVAVASFATGGREFRGWRSRVATFATGGCKFQILLLVVANFGVFCGSFCGSLGTVFFEQVFQVFRRSFPSFDAKFSSEKLQSPSRIVGFGARSRARENFKFGGGKLQVWGWETCATGGI